jgi:uncharacterized protein (TIGR03067 family)
MKRTWGVLLAFSLLGAQPNADSAVKKDLKALEGTWVMAGLEVNGIDVPVNKLDGTELTIKDDLYALKAKDKVFKVVLKLDPSKDPKEIDMIFQEGANKDKVHKGIYKVEKGQFKICRGLNPEQHRPNQFATWPNTNYFVATWKRKN